MKMEYLKPNNMNEESKVKMIIVSMAGCIGLLLCKYFTNLSIVESIGSILMIGIILDFYITKKLK